MTKTALQALGTLVLALVVGTADRDDNMTPGRVVLGVLDGEDVYTCSVGPQQNNRLFPGRLCLWRARKPDSVSRHCLPSHPSLDSGQSYEQYEFRWRIGHKHCWYIVVSEMPGASPGFAIVRLPLRSIDLFTLGPKDSVPAFENADRATIEKLVADSALPGAAAVKPLSEAVLRASLQEPEPVHYDLLPTAEDRCHVFIHWKGQMSVWEGSVKNLNKENPLDSSMSVEWAEREKFSLGFSEPFFVLSRDLSVFFVTESGKLYRTNKLEDGRGQVLVSGPEASPSIQAIIMDLARERTYLFGTERKAEARRFVFELDEQLRLHPFRPGAKKPVEAPEPAKTVMEYVQFLRESKRNK